MRIDTVDVFVKIDCMLGEGPCWNARTSELSWVDIKTGTLYRLSSSGEMRTLQTGQYLGAAIPTESGRFIGCMTTGIYMLGDDEVIEKLDSPEGMTVHQRFNDAKCDPRGRLFAGTMPLFSRYMGEGGGLYRYAGGRAEKMPFDVILANGLAWSNDGRTMYFNDTPLSRIDAFDYNPEDGSLSNRREAVKVAGAPDGMTIDAEGKLWTAIWGAGEVRRYDPETGEILQVVKVPAKFSTSCCFGGDDLKTLFITSAAENDEAPLAGCVFACVPGVQGTDTVLYNDLA